MTFPVFRETWFVIWMNALALAAYPTIPDLV